LVIFDPSQIDAGPLRKVSDLPGGGSRLITRPLGVNFVLVGGKVLVENGAVTRQRGGRLLRSGRDTGNVLARGAE
jgi:N-acyl-D-aspartate/D-glutamate deacylase